MRTLSSIFLLACFAFYSQSEAINRQVSVSQQPDYAGIASSDREFQKATKLIREGKYQKAQDVINQLIQDFPQEAPLYNNLAMIYLRHNKLDEGKALLTQGLKTSPNYYVIYENLQKIKQYEARLSYNSVLGEKTDMSKLNYRFVLIDKLHLPDGWEETSQIQIASKENIVDTQLLQNTPKKTKPEISLLAKNELKQPEPKKPEVKKPEVPVARKVVRDAKPSDAKQGLSQEVVESIAKEVKSKTEEQPISKKPNQDNSSIRIAGLQEKSNKTMVKDIQNEFENWLRAWSSGNFQNYISFYSEKFNARNMNIDAWKKYRSKRVSPGRNISVSYTNLKVSLVSQTEVKLTYNQSYKSKSFAAKARKSMTWVLDGGNWKIVNERAL